MQQTYGDVTHPLNEEAVFCSYYKLSGETIDERDLEDFSYQQGQPTFSIFKPAEMFTKATLCELQKKIQKQISAYDAMTLFAMNFKGPWYGGNFIQGAAAIVLGHSELPNSTPYIGSEMSEPGQKELLKTYYSLLKESAGLIKSREINITVYLQPIKILRKYLKRNIAQEDVYMPMRIVIFEPVRIRISFQVQTGRLILFREIVKS
jgi:hypothetical protein